MRYTGLSGIDTESMVQQLMKAESMKYDKLYRQRQLVEWKQEAYHDVANTMKTFSATFLQMTNLTSNIRAVSSFNKFNTSAKIGDKDSAAVKVTASKAGEVKLLVKRLAAAEAYETNRVAVSARGEETFSWASLNFGDSITIRLDNGSDKTITMDQLPFATEAEFTDWFNGKLEAAFGTEPLLNTQGSQPSQPPSKVQAAIKDGKLDISAVNVGHTITVVNNSGSANKFGFAAGSTTSKLQASTLADLGFTGGGTLKVNGEDIIFDANMSADNFLSKLNTVSGVSASYDSKKEVYVLKSTGTGVENAIAFAGDMGAFGASTFTKVSDAQDALIELDGVEISRSTNKFTVDGLSLELLATTETSAGSGVYDTISIKAEANVDDTLNLIKKFVEEYNSMLEKLNTQYNTSRAKSSSYTKYEPLTSDEKAAMTEKEVELWEAKAKEGMLYRDEIVNSVISSMRSMLYEPVTLSDGKKISLWELGITTSSSRGNEAGKLVIDETKLRSALTDRAEDVTQLFTKSSDKYSYSSTTKKDYYNLLRDEGLGDRLYHIIENATSSSGTISLRAGVSKTDYNSVLAKQLTDIDTSITDAINKLTAKEEQYYLMFSKMEAAISQNSAMMSQMQSLLGIA
jgi:flagellar hook-associated protein 2